MIKLAILRVKPGEEPHLRNWMAELNRRSTEVLETFANEGMRHEQAYLLQTSDGPILIYAMEAADHDRVASAFRDSTLPIDHEHRQIMKQVLAGPAKVELLYECKVKVTANFSSNRRAANTVARSTPVVARRSTNVKRMTRSQLHEIAVRRCGDADVKALLLEVKRLHGVLVRTHELAGGLGALHRAHPTSERRWIA